MSNFDESFFKQLLREEREECLKGPGIDLELHEAFVEACQEFQTLRESLQEQLQTKTTRKAKQDIMASTKKQMDDALQQCVEAATPILESISLSEYDLEMSLLRTAIITRSTPKGLAAFANESDLHGQLIETLLNNKKIMKEMLLGGGAKGNEFGSAMKWYTQIMAQLPKDRFQKVHRRLALACALELAVPQTEFDTSVEISPLERFQHYEKAHRKGELDPSFTHFKTWEYRMAINSDAPHKQLQWGRDMLWNYAPHIVSIYNEQWRYNYIVKTDVGYRAPQWTSSPRTYPQVLSGGGREGPRSWFSRFICQAFGIPVWGMKQPLCSNVCHARWTPKGWYVNFGVASPNPEVWPDMQEYNWTIGQWDGGRLGADFWDECRARAAVSEQEYYEKVLLLECLADACKEKNKKIEDAGFVHPAKVWRSLALMQRKLFADQVKEDDESFVRTGPSLAVCKLDTYLEELLANKDPLPVEKLEDGSLRIPAASIASSNGEKVVKAHPSLTQGQTQLHLMEGAGEATYDISVEEYLESSSSTDFELSAMVCTVHLEQQPLMIDIDHKTGSVETYQIDIPYTQGEWETTDPVKVSIQADRVAEAALSMRIYRRKANDCFGLAIQSFTLKPV